MWKIAGVMVVVSLVIGAAVWQAREPRVQDRTAYDTAEVRLSEKGFSPVLTYVHPGTRVTFINDSKRAMWPASDSHPSHTLYREFDPMRAIPPGESWTFTFDRVGSWAFHDHLRATMRGTVVVLSLGDTPGATTGCAEEDQRPCWNAQISQALQRSVGDALDAVRELNATQPLFSQRCHQFTHDLGLLSYVEYGTRIQFSNKLGYCDYGFFHGYMEGFFTDHDSADAYAFCARVAEALDDIDEQMAYQCTHGIGHGMMEFLLHTDPEYWSDPPAAARKALEACRVLGEEGDVRFRCASGAYSVLADWLLQGGKESVYFSSADPFMLCALADEEWAKRGCVWETSKRLRVLAGSTLVSGEDFVRFFTLVERSAESFASGAYTDSIIISAAHLLGEKSVHATDAFIRDACHRGFTTANERTCIMGAVDGLLFSGEPENEAPRAVAFCTSAILRAEEAQACARTLATTLRHTYMRQQLESACAVLRDKGLDVESCPAL